MLPNTYKLPRELGPIINAYKMKLWDFVVYLRDEDICSCIISFVPTEKELEDITNVEQCLFGPNPTEEQLSTIIHWVDFIDRTRDNPYAIVDEECSYKDPVNARKFAQVIDSYEELKEFVCSYYEGIFTEQPIDWVGAAADCDFEEDEDDDGS